MNIKILIESGNAAAVSELLDQDPSLANQGVPVDENNTVLAHPLHRICDGVFAGRYSEDYAVEIAKIFLAHGAKVDGVDIPEKKDTPLIAAASLCADQLAFLYIDHGADIFHRGTHGGTALHWAAWCGRDRIVKVLIEAGAEINQRCYDFLSTPLFWALHGFRHSNKKNMAAYGRIVEYLLKAGADKAIPNFEGYSVYDLLEEKDAELKAILDTEALQ